MAAKAKKPLERNRDLGVIRKKLASGMYETDKKEKIPPFPGVSVGDKVKIENGRFVLDMKKSKESIEPVDPKDKEIAALKAKNAALEAQVGEQGSKIGQIEETLAVQGEKIDGVTTAKDNVKTPPKVEGAE